MRIRRKYPPKLILNTASILIPDKKIVVGRQPFNSGEELRELRNSHVGTHIFKRRGDTIVDIPVLPGAKALGASEEMEIKSDLGLCKTLIREAYIRYLNGLGRTILNLEPVDFVSEEDLLRACIPKGVVCPNWLSVRLRYQIDVRTHYMDAPEPTIALVLSVRTALIIDTRCSELLKSGIDIRKLYIQEVLPQSDSRLRERRPLVGKVIEVKNGMLLLADSRDDRSSIESTEAYLEPRRENFHLCIRTCLGISADTVLRQLESAISQANGGRGRLRKIREVMRHLEKLPLEMVPGVNFKLGTLYSQAGSPGTFPTVDEEHSPVYVFDAGTQTAQWHDRGLDDFGPYDQRTFTPTRPEIAVICQSRYRGQTEQFLRKLLDGIHGFADRYGRERFGKGLLKKYCLDKCQLEFFEADNETPDGYRHAIARAIDTATERGSKWSLAIVQIQEQFHSLDGDANPYLVSKGTFLSHGITSQEVEIETMLMPEEQLVFTLNNFALACYAKLGGIPWLLQANRGIAYELVLGLGSASVGEGRFGSRQRIVGITTVFSGDGNYLLENRSKATTLEEYPKVLLDSLQATVNHIRQILNWQPRDSIRLIFHAFKPFRFEQIDAVKEVMKGLGDFEVQFAFLHVIDNHPYLLFDEANTEGVWDAQARAKKGQFAPSRGHWLKLSDYESLLILTGAGQVKRPEDGLPSPILLHLDRNSTFKDMKYLTRQAYHFSCHSWRSFFPSPMPITILYSELIASLLGNLCRLSKWDSQTMLGPIGRTRWFL